MDESEIILSIQNGNNQKVLEYLYKEPLRQIRNYILSNSGSIDDANDVFQDAVIALFNYIKTGKYKPEYDMKAFLFRVAKNAYIDKIRKDKRIVNSNELESISKETEVSILEIVMEKEKMVAFSEIFEKLEDRCKQILKLILFEKKSMKEVKELLGYKHENVVKSQHYRCKKYLANLIINNKEAFNLIRN